MLTPITVPSSGRAEDIPLVLQGPRNASEPQGGTASFVCEPSPDAPETSQVRWVHLPPGEDVGAALNDTVMKSHEVEVSGGGRKHITAP